MSNRTTVFFWPMYDKKVETVNFQLIDVVIVRYVAIMLLFTEVSKIESQDFIET